MINGLDFLLIYAAFYNNYYCRYTGFFPRRWTWTGDFKCMEVKTGFCRKRWTQTGSSGTLIGWKSGQTTFIPLWDRMEGAWLWTPDISLIWLMDWFTCWYTRHSLTMGLNGLVYNFKFGIFAWYPFFAGKNYLVKIRTISGFFPKSRIFSGFFPKSRTFSGFSPKNQDIFRFSPQNQDIFHFIPLHGLDNMLVNLFPTNKTIRNVIFRKFITDIKTV